MAIVCIICTSFNAVAVTKKRILQGEEKLQRQVRLVFIKEVC